jgi:hypothetical protein
MAKVTANKRSLMMRQNASGGGEAGGEGGEAALSVEKMRAAVSGQVEFLKTLDSDG